MSAIGNFTVRLRLGLYGNGVGVDAQTTQQICHAAEGAVAQATTHKYSNAGITLGNIFNFRAVVPE